MPGAGPVSVPTANLGNQNAAHASIKNAAESLQQALLQMPMGSEEHTQLLEIVKKLSKMSADSAVGPHDQMQGLVAMARKQAQGGAPPGLNAIMPAMPAPPPGGGDAPPPPGA